MSKERVIKSISIYREDHPNLYRAISVGDNVSRSEFASASHFIAQAAEEKLASRGKDNITNKDLLDQIETLCNLIEEIKHYAPTNRDVDDRLEVAKNVMKVRRAKRS